MPFSLLLVLVLAACQQVDDPQIAYDPATLAFSGDRALNIQSEFVEAFPDRASGRPNNALAAAWLQERMTALGWGCEIDRWQVINDGAELPLNNILCALPGQSEQTILLAAHIDQSSMAVQGADSDGSGIGIALQLAEIFAAEAIPHHSLEILFSDGAVYGNLGARRFVGAERDLGEITAISLDNMGMALYDGLQMSPTGQFRGYGPLWLQKVAQEATAASDNQWVAQIPGLSRQLLQQVVPISIMDQGPFVAAGVPAFGLTGSVPASQSSQFWRTRYSPEDTMDLQSAAVLQQSGRAAEALVRQLNTMESTPRESGPYLYNQESDAVLRGPLLWLLLLAFAVLFLALAVLTGRRLPGGFDAAMRVALPHLVGLWVPVIGSVLILYLCVRIGLMNDYAVYPASPKDAVLTDPHWLVIILWLIGFWELLQFGRRLAGLYMANRPVPSFAQRKVLAAVVIGLAAFYVIAKNPFSVLVMLPLLLWLFIGGRSGAGRVLDWLLFLAGGLAVYGLGYYFGFQLFDIDFAIMWYAMMMVSIGMISFPTAMVIAAVLAAGLSLVAKPPIGRRRTEALKTQS